MQQILPRSLATLVVLCLIGQTAWAQIPNNLDYQGYLTKNGLPFTGQAVLDVFMNYAPRGGTQEWSQTQSNGQVTQGYYSAMLDLSDGQHSSKSTQSFNKAYWLEVHID